MIYDAKADGSSESPMVGQTGHEQEGNDRADDADHPTGQEPSARAGRPRSEQPPHTPSLYSTRALLRSPVMGPRAGTWQVRCLRSVGSSFGAGA